MRLSFYSGLVFAAVAAQSTRALLVRQADHAQVEVESKCEPEDPQSLTQAETDPHSSRDEPFALA